MGVGGRAREGLPASAEEAGGWGWGELSNSAFFSPWEEKM